MKVKFKYGIRTFSGTLDEMTYGSYRNGGVCIGRRWVYPKLTDNHSSMGAKLKNIGIVYRAASSGYKDDLTVYCVRNGRQNVPKTKLVPSSYAIFVKMMFAWAKESGGLIDLSSVDIEDVQGATAGINTIADAVENGFIKAVTDYVTLSTSI